MTKAHKSAPLKAIHLLTMQNSQPNRVIRPYQPIAMEGKQQRIIEENRKRGNERKQKQNKIDWQTEENGKHAHHFGVIDLI